MILHMLHHLGYSSCGNQIKGSQLGTDDDEMGGGCQAVTFDLVTTVAMTPSVGAGPQKVFEAGTRMS